MPLTCCYVITKQAKLRQYAHVEKKNYKFVIGDSIRKIKKKVFFVFPPTGAFHCSKFVVICFLNLAGGVKGEHFSHFDKSLT